MRITNKTILIINRLKEHYNFKNDVEFAIYLGVATTTLSSWKSRDSLDYDLVYAKCVGIDGNWLLSGEGEMVRNVIPKSIAASPITEYRTDKYVLQLEKEVCFFVCNDLLKKKKGIFLFEQGKQREKKS